jgi:hypothetical protein
VEALIHVELQFCSQSSVSFRHGLYQTLRFLPTYRGRPSCRRLRWFQGEQVCLLSDVIAHVLYEYRLQMCGQVGGLPGNFVHCCLSHVLSEPESAGQALDTDRASLVRRIGSQSRKYNPPNWCTTALSASNSIEVVSHHLKVGNQRFTCYISSIIPICHVSTA